MIILLLLIFLLLAGIVATDVISTLAGGIAFIVILLIVYIVRNNNRANQTTKSEPLEYQVEREDGAIYCDDCKYCYGDSQAGACLLGHENPKAGVFCPACEDDFLPRNAPLPGDEETR